MKKKIALGLFLSLSVAASARAGGINLGKIAGGLANTVVHDVEQPWVCSTTNPWNQSYEGRGQTEAEASNSAVSACGIFDECSQNVSCSNVSPVNTSSSRPSAPAVASYAYGTDSQGGTHCYGVDANGNYIGSDSDYVNNSYCQ